MEKIEISTPEPEKVLPILRDAIERQKRLLSQNSTKSSSAIYPWTRHTGIRAGPVLARARLGLADA